MDGLSILHMTESNIFSLIPGIKIGTGSRLCILNDKMKHCVVQNQKYTIHVKEHSIYEYDQNSSEVKRI